MDKITAFPLFAFIAFIVLLYIVYFTAINVKKNISKKRKQFVLDSSPTIAKINSLNDTATFHNIPNPFKHTMMCSSKQQYNKANLKSLFVIYAEENYDELVLLLEKAEENRKEFSEYELVFEKILESDLSDSFKATYRYYTDLEKQLCKEMRLTPELNVLVTIGKSYTSPQGRNHYFDCQSFSDNDISDVLKRIKENKVLKENKEHQRLLMTDSLRYDILKRDNFRCVLCGISASQGAILHVDHILPVSKGGKTIPKNLRTLCDRCNMGKSDKYDYKGLN